MLVANSSDATSTRRYALKLQNILQILDLLAVDAVGSEPFSVCISLLRREFTGKSCKIGLKYTHGHELSSAFAWHLWQIPCLTEQGIHGGHL